MKKKLLSVLLAAGMVLSLTACGSKASTEESSEEAAKEETYTIGFVNIGPGEVFEEYASAYESAMTEAGWEASTTNGEFDPNTQISQIENYIAQGVDVLIVFPSSGEAVSAAVDKAMEAGIKVISFVNETENFDVHLTSDDSVVSAYTCELAAKWVEENFPDAEDGSVKACAVVYYANETNVAQSEPLLKIEEYSSKISLEKIYEVSDEDIETGVTAAEDIYTTNPDINLFLVSQSQIALGMNNYYTSLNSPVTDYSDLGIFTINGSTEIYKTILSSADGESPLRGLMLPSGYEAFGKMIVKVANGLMNDELETPSVIYATNEVVIPETAEEVLETGFATSYTTDDLDALFPDITYTTPTDPGYPVLDISIE